MSNPNDRCFYPVKQEDRSIVACNKKRHSHSMYAKRHPFTEGARCRVCGAIEFYHLAGQMHTFVAGDICSTME